MPVTYAALLLIVPLWPPLPESVAVDPDPSSNFHQPMSPVVMSDEVNAGTTIVGLLLEIIFAGMPDGFICVCANEPRQKARSSVIVRLVFINKLPRGKITRWTWSLNNHAFQACWLEYPRSQKSRQQ